MKLEWLDVDDFNQLQKTFNIYSTKYSYDVNNGIKQFIEKYPNPMNWIFNDKTDTLTFTSGYVFVWAVKNKLFTNELIKIQLLKNFFNSELKSTFYRFVVSLNVLSPEELKQIDSYSRAVSTPLRKYLPFLLLCCNSNLSQLGAEKIDVLINTFHSIHPSKFSKKMIQNLMFDLGYSNKIGMRALRTTSNVFKLTNHRILGHIFRDYYEFLNANGTKSITITNNAASLYTFVNYLDKNKIDSSKIESKTVVVYLNTRLDNGIKKNTINTEVPRLFNFFEWAHGQYPEFSEQINYPTDFMRMIRQESNRIRNEEDGLAFANEEIPDKIVEFLLKFEPQNDDDFLCKHFWLLISSTPIRQKLALNLEYRNCLYPLLNDNDVYGVYSIDEDKAGNKNGHFPIFDEIGIESITRLEERIEKNAAAFPQVYNAEKKRTFIHLFQRLKPYKPLSKSIIYNFKETKIIPYLAENMQVNPSDIKFGTHAFRHYLLTHVVRKTGSEEAARAAGGHHDGKMIRSIYLKSKHAKNALLFRALDKFETGEITGKFYLKLIDILTDESTEIDSDIMMDLSSQMEFEEFILKHGRATEIGYCFDEDHTCNHYLKCWSCPSFMLRRDEVTGAIKLLRRLMNDFDDIVKNSKNFDIKNTVAQNKLQAISMVKERLSDLKYTDEQIETMLYNLN